MKRRKPSPLARHARALSRVLAKILEGEQVLGRLPELEARIERLEAKVRDQELLLERALFRELPPELRRQVKKVNAAIPGGIRQVEKALAKVVPRAARKGDA